jgi:hypothetical protein
MRLTKEKGIDWVALTRIDEGASNYGAPIPLIPGLNSMATKLEG